MGVLVELERKFDEAFLPEDVFGAGDDWGPGYKELAKQLHPDRYPDAPDKEQALGLFKRLGDWKQLAEQPLTLRGPSGVYQLGRELGRGDVAEVRYGRDEKGQPCVIKQARTLAVSKLLAKERELLLRLQEESVGTNYGSYLHTVLETFLLPDKRRVNVLHYPLDYIPLEQAVERYPALRTDARHLVWFFKRLCSVMGYIHLKNWVHGAVLPCHLLINPANHGLLLADWTLAAAPGKVMTAVPANFKEWYPPEVKKKQPISAATDLYLAASCVCWLAGGDPLAKTFPKSVPASMQTFLSSCWLESAGMRLTEAWRVFDRWDDLAFQLYGVPTFLVLKA